MSSKSSKKSVVSDSIYNSAGNYFGHLCNAVKGFYSAKFLGPEGFGLWSIIQFYVNFGIFLPLGIDYYVQRQIAQNLKVRKDAENFFLIKLIALYSLLFSAFVIVIGCIVLTFISKEKDPLLYYGVIFVFASIAGQLSERFIFALLTAYGHFKANGLNRALRGLVGLGVVILLIEKHQIFAMYWAYALSYIGPSLIILGIYIKKIVKNAGLVARADSKDAKPLKIIIRQSLQICGIMFLNNIMYRLENFFITSSYSTLENGLYFMAVNITNALNVAFASSMAVSYQRMNMWYGQRKDKGEVFDYSMEVAGKVTMLYPFVMALAYYILPIIFHLMFPKFMNSIPLLKILVFAGYFKAIYTLYGFHALAVKAQRILLYQRIVVVFIGCIIFFLGSRHLSILNITYLSAGVNFMFMLAGIILSHALSDVKFRVYPFFKSFLLYPAFFIIILFFTESIDWGCGFITEMLIKMAVSSTVYLIVIIGVRNFITGKE